MSGKTADYLKNTGKTLMFSVCLPACFLLALWQLQSFRIGSPLVLPPPAQVCERLFSLVRTGIFWQHVCASALRSFWSFTLSLVLSVLLGTLAGVFDLFGKFLSFPMGIIKASPVVSFILLAIFWFSTDTVPVFIGLLMTLPLMTGSFAAGVSNTDKKLLEMARVYGFTPVQKLRYVYIPSIIPYFLSGALTAFSLSWKVVAAAEVISLPKRGLGTALQTAKAHIETADVFAYTIAVVLLSYIAERILAALFTKGVQS